MSNKKEIERLEGRIEAAELDLRQHLCKHPFVALGFDSQEGRAIYRTCTLCGLGGYIEIAEKERLELGYIADKLEELAARRDKIVERADEAERIRSDKARQD